MFAPATAPSPSPSPLSNTAPAISSPAPTSRTGRLRGLNYLRSYTHSHLHPHSSHSTTPADPEPLTPPLRSTSFPGSNPAPPRGWSSGGQVERPQDEELPLQSNSGEAGRGPTSAWLPTVGGRSGLSRVATRPQSTATAAPAAELSGVYSDLQAAVGSNLPASMGRTKSSSRQNSRRDDASTVYGAASREPGRLDGTNGSSPTGPVAPVNSNTYAGRSPDVERPTGTDGATSNNLVQAQMPSIRFIPHQDPRASRPSLAFVAVSRTLPSSTSVIRVGRYSEKDSDTNVPSYAPSAAPVGFKSKVVSRRHCELWCSSGQWYIKDVKSSSGTFLNHIRLSQPNLESKPFPLNDGDVVQLGIDFKGGEEMIFRCVKIRVECNRGWQKALNSFNTNTHKRLRDLAAKTDNVHSSECSICLLSIAPCQSLFVAPCSHVWHYKCIRPILNGSTWPQFLCPNCRAVSDLEAEVDEPIAEWEDDLDSGEPLPEAKDSGPEPGPQRPDEEADGADDGIDQGLATMIRDVSLDGGPHGSGMTDSPPGLWAPERGPGGSRQGPRSSVSNRKLDSVEALNLASRAPPVQSGPSTKSSQAEPSESWPRGEPAEPVAAPSTPRRSDPSNGSPGPEGPITPRNDAGPFVFDGSAGRRRGSSALRDQHEADTEGRPDGFP
ncbi:MAG: hypothetical protein M1832_004313 [Thelocarpon impressellum]|nr:MAG: hypothetical protein M1832_004313 [Thelocarpon impressellum]